ncbi:non-ribosomal peptide synthetase [Hamadaea tsunoensis]|uniref:non-ribosomal peptide synthetase n=1 Tax=Hamadaea tsunoensis TaxID=53368 RepID=UPI0004067FE8|nr:non-ribosomal peptide synthetase [Hamadaea tsunoensis]
MTAARNVLVCFDEQCARRPDAIAVVDADASRTYAQLDAESAAYAAALRTAGARPETVVPVVAARSGRYVAMVLGVLRAGAAFLPVDPETPARRAREMSTAVGASVVFAEPGRETYAAQLHPNVVTTVPEHGGAGQGSVHREDAGLAYVIFTSGSTGTPKGAMVTDGGLANHTAAKVIDLDLGPDDAVAFTAALSFDISVWQVLTALSVGARVVVASPVDVSEPFELLGWVRRHGVTVLELVPSYMAVLLDEVELDGGLVRSLATLRFLIATGEALPLALARRWQAHLPQIALVNAYGPTECSDDVTHHIVTRAECDAGRPPSIGREIVHTRIYLVDTEADGPASGAALPPGMDGEMLVGGDGVGRGYIGDPVRTALAFVPDHLSGVPGARLYRTGDRARRAADGTIDFLGRRDRQIKLRGQRVELGEVEAELARVPAVTAAAAVFVRQRLHAFVTGAVDADAVLRAMRASAPGFLIPHDVTVLDRLPTNANGKVDHGALERTLAPPESAQDSAPAGPAEVSLDGVRAAVAEVLDAPQVGPDDDFFAAGGDSLLAMRLLSLARERFDAQDVPLRGFLAEPTPRRLLGLLSEARADAHAPDLAGEATSSALSSGQERLWFLEQLHPSRYVQLIRLRLDLRGDLDQGALEHALGAVVERHEPLRTTIANDRGKPSAVIAPHAKVHIEVVDGSDRDLSGPVDAQGLSSRTQTPPLMRVELVRLAPDHHVLSLVMHHLVADGFSIGVLAAEIGAFYRAYREGGPDLPAPASTYSRYVAAERRWLDGPEAAATEQFWRDTLAGAPELALPFTHPHPASPTFQADHVVRVLTPTETANVREAARAGRATPIMAVTAALAAVLRQLSGRDDLVLGLDSANRSWPGTEDLIGTFVNQLPLRLRCEPGEQSFAGLLDLVRRQSFAAYAQDRLPFHKIVAAVNPQRRAGRFPLFQVKITHQGGWRDTLTLPGLTVTADMHSEPVTDLDLMLDVSGEADRLRLELVYRPEVLDRAVADTWLDAVVDVLRTGCADPAAPIAPQPAGPGHEEGRPQ